MAAAASWVFDTSVQDHRADVLECPPAELAGEIAGNVAVERLVVATVRIAYARVQKKSPQARVLLPAVYAVERAVGVALEQGVITPSARMACAGVKEKRPRVSIRLSAVFAVLAHVTPSQISTSQLPNFRPPTRRMILSLRSLIICHSIPLSVTPNSRDSSAVVT